MEVTEGGCDYFKVEVAGGGIYLADSRLSKYPSLTTDTEVNSCFSLY